MGRGRTLFEDRYRAALADKPLSRSERRELRARISREVKEVVRSSQVTRQPFGDCRVLSPRGELMFRTYRARFDWYLAHTSCRLLAEDPPTLQLAFEPTGPGYLGDAYHLQPRLNLCVACGTTSNLTKHHVLPRLYRRHFPKSYVRRNQHDILLLCIHCHDAYEVQAEKKKVELARAHGLPAWCPPMVPDPVLSVVSKAAWAIHLHGDRIPATRRQPLIAALQGYFGKADIGGEELARARRLEFLVPNPSYVDVGREVVRREEPQTLLEDWRRHFIDTMSPRFLPPEWDIRRPVALDIELECKPWPWELAAARESGKASPDARPSGEHRAPAPAPE